MKKKIVVLAGVLFLLVMTAATLVAQNRYQASLPEVTLGIPRSGAVTVRHEVSGTAEGREDGTYQTAITFSRGEWTGAIPFTRGDAVTVELGNRVVQGEVVSFLPGEDGAICFLICFDADDVKSGDRVEITMEKQSREVPTVLPLRALQYDGDYFVWLVEEVPGPWSNKYVVKKEYVDIWFMGVEQVALSSQICLPVVVAAETPLTEGQTVRFDL